MASIGITMEHVIIPLCSGVQIGEQMVEVILTLE
jgi:hypothetical protein